MRALEHEVSACCEPSLPVNKRSKSRLADTTGVIGLSINWAFIELMTTTRLWANWTQEDATFDAHLLKSQDIDVHAPPTIVVDYAVFLASTF